MRALRSWIEDFVAWEGSTADLAAALTAVGLAVERVEERGADAVLEVDVTSNRGDCLSHLGLARELAAATGCARHSDPKPAAPSESADPAGDLVTVTVEAGDLCPAYSARVITGLDGGAATPPPVARRLEALGLRLVHPIVDISNYVMLERGQPLHAFDRARLAGGCIVVRRSREGESITTLDGRERRLPAGLLVIADAEKPVAVAGLMGSKDSEVTAATTAVVLESARFAPAAVRAAGQALGLVTDASSRFTRRVDPAETDRSSLRALALIAEAVGGTVHAGRVAAGPALDAEGPTEPVALRFARLDALLGVGVDPETVVGSLEALGFAIRERDADRVTVGVPSHRGDVAVEEDLVEEVARLQGYDRIPARLSLPARPVRRHPEARALDAVRSVLVGQGFHEALTLPFVAPGAPDDASPWTDRPAVRVDNPTRAEEPLLRRSLLGPLLRCLERNRARGVTGARLFEVSTVFLPRADDPRPEERRLVGGVLEGTTADARGAVDALIAGLGLDGLTVAVADPALAPRLDPLDAARTAAFRLADRPLGWVGAIRADRVAALGVHHEGLAVAAFELDAAVLFEAARLDRPVRIPSPFPQVVRDLSILVAGDVRWGDVEATARGAGGEHLRDVVVFDDYRGKGVPAGHRSLAFRLTFGAPDRTLRGEEVDAAVAAVVAALEATHGASLRG